jgi:hypothetical protein
MKRRIVRDETNRMARKVGVWRSLGLSSPPEVDTPTYDVVGPIERFDERDHVFSRIAMKGGTPSCRVYYLRHMPVGVPLEPCE